MSENKKQHFVPQMLQGFFSLDGRNIGCYHIKNGNCYNSPISNTAQKSWLYKINDADRTSIEHIYGNIEGDAKPILQRVQVRDFDLTIDEIDHLFLFVVSQLMRTPKAANAIGAVLDLCIEKGFEVVCEEVKSGIRDKTNLPMQASIAIPKVAEHLSGKGFLFVCNDTTTKFLLSDNPCCMFSPVTEMAEDKHIVDLMFVQEPFSGYMLYMPLGPSVGILCFDDDYYEFNRKGTIDATEEDVKTLNALEVVNANDIIIYQDGTFNADDITKALSMRSTDKFLRYQQTIYTPIEKSFSLSGLNLDEDNLVYLINRFAIEKNAPNPLTLSNEKIVNE